MTIIAWDGKYLAADKLVLNRYTKGTSTKIYKIPVKEEKISYRVGGTQYFYPKGYALIGGAGCSSAISLLMDWFVDGAHYNSYPFPYKDFYKDYLPASLLVISNDKKIFTYEFSPSPLVCEDKCAAIGCGYEIALTALSQGRSAKEAVEFASNLNAGCGLGCDVLSFDD